MEKAGHKQVGVYISIGKLEELIHYLLTQEKPKSVERKLLAVVSREIAGAVEHGRYCALLSRRNSQSCAHSAAKQYCSQYSFDCLLWHQCSPLVQLQAGSAAHWCT